MKKNVIKCYKHQRILHKGNGEEVTETFIKEICPYCKLEQIKSNNKPTMLAIKKMFNIDDLTATELQILKAIYIDNGKATYKTISNATAKSNDLIFKTLGRFICTGLIECLNVDNEVAFLITHNKLINRIRKGE